MTRRWLWSVAVGIAAMVVVLGFLGPYFSGRHLTGPASGGVLHAEGTTGREALTATDSVASSATIQELDTITGAVDGHELIGRRVELRLVANGVTTHGAFWVGSPGNRILVAPASTQQNVARDLREGESVTILGTVQSMPKAKERLSWGLTAPDLIQLTEQPIYIRVERIRL